MHSKPKQLAKEIKRRQKERAKRPKFRVEDYCFDKQLNFILDPAKFKTAVCSRRAGKTEACAADLVDTALSNPNTNCLYITLSRKSAKRIIWKNLLMIVKKYQIEVAKIDNVELTIDLANGSTIYVSGAKDLTEIDKFRGMALIKVYIDEAQSFKPYLKELIDEVIEPALYDHDGSLAMIGTPNAACAGVFYDACHQKEGFVEWSPHHWTIHDNPHILRKSGKTPEQLLAATLKRKGITASNPAFRRESLGQWVYDPDSLIYKFSKDKNLYTRLPTGHHWEYILGADIGYMDADAVAVIAFSRTSPDVYLVEEIIREKQDITSLANIIKELQTRYSFVKSVMDAGALGKKIQEELRQRHHIHLEAAEKHRKAEFIELMNDDLRNGRFLVQESMTIVDDWALLQWDKTDPTKWKEDRGFHSDITDAVLYAWRESKHFTFEPAYDEPDRESAAWMAMQEEREIAELESGDSKEFWEDGYDNDEINLGDI